MFFQKSSLFVLLSLLQESTAINPIQGPITGDVTKYETTVPGMPSLTVVHADVVAPSGSTAVIDFDLSTPVKSPSSSTKVLTSPLLSRSLQGLLQSFTSAPFSAGTGATVSASGNSDSSTALSP
ncbi:unnamed protein product [Penicillium pancosmium]